MSIKYRIVTDGKTHIKKSRNINGDYNLGVFASVNLKRGEIIEKAPFLEIVPNGNELAYPLGDYVFESHLNPNNYILVFGHGSMYNHSPDNNVVYYIDDSPRTMKYIANRNILAGEELCINYGSEHSVNKLL